MKINKHIETLMKIGIIGNLIIFLLSLIFNFDSLSLISVTLINAFIYFLLIISNKYAYLFDTMAQTNKFLKSLNSIGGN